MKRTLVRRLLQFTTLVCGLGMLLLLIPLFMGSAEQFPTGEQEEKLRIAVASLMLLLAAAGGACLLAVKRMQP